MKTHSEVYGLLFCNLHHHLINDYFPGNSCILLLIHSFLIIVFASTRAFALNDEKPFFILGKCANFTTTKYIEKLYYDKLPCSAMCWNLKKFAETRKITIKHKGNEKRRFMKTAFLNPFISKFLIFIRFFTLYRRNFLFYPYIDILLWKFNHTK